MRGALSEPTLLVAYEQGRKLKLDEAIAVGLTAGTYGNVATSGRTVYKVDGAQVDKTQNPPRCKIAGSLYLTDGWYPTGAAVPANGFTPSAALLKAMAINSADNGLTGYTVAPSRRCRCQSRTSW